MLIDDGLRGNNTIKLYKPKSFYSDVIGTAGNGHTREISAANMGFPLFSQ